MTGDQEGDALRADVGVGQPFAGLAVDAGEHPAEQVGGVPGLALGPPLGDEPVDQVVHERLVLLHLPLRPDLQPGLDRQLPRPCLGLGEGAHHGLHERMRCVAVEGVEPVPEPAQGDGVEGQAGHVVGDVHLVALVEAVPLVHQLVRDVDHPRHVVAHRLQAERRHQDVVGAVPERVVGLGREQARVDCSLPQGGQPATDPLVEAGVVTDLLDELRAGDDQAGAAGHAELEDRPVLLGHRHEPLDRMVGVDVERVPHEGQAGGAGNVVEVDRHAHGRSSGRGSVSGLGERRRGRCGYGGAGAPGDDEEHDAQQQHPAGEHQQDRRVEGGADEQERGAEVAHGRHPAWKQPTPPRQGGRRDHVHAGGADAEDEDHAVAGGGERARHLGGRQRGGREDREQGHGAHSRRTREEHADEEHARRELQPARDPGRRPGQRLDERSRRAHVPQVGDSRERHDVQPGRHQHVPLADGVEVGVDAVRGRDPRRLPHEHQRGHEEPGEDDPGHRAHPGVGPERLRGPFATTCASPGPRSTGRVDDTGAGHGRSGLFRRCRRLRQRSPAHAPRSHLLRDAL